MKTQYCSTPTIKTISLLCIFLLSACGGSGEQSRNDLANSQQLSDLPQPEIVRQQDIYQFAKGCYQLSEANSNLFLSNVDQQYSFTEGINIHTSRFYMQPTGLGSYLLYDHEGYHLIIRHNQLKGKTDLDSEMTLNISEDIYLQSEAEWRLVANNNAGTLHLRHIKTQRWLSREGTTNSKQKAAAIHFNEASDCKAFPEANTGASGAITKTFHENGMLWGYADPHEHLQSSYGFSQRVFHGATFHKLGIKHALPNCEKNHGKHGMYDIMGIVTKNGSARISPNNLTSRLIQHLTLGKPDHSNQGYPRMTDWSTHTARTHQQLYYKWIERAYLSGLRLMVDYFLSAEVMCEVIQDAIPNISDERDCNEMRSVDRQIEKTKELESYIDAQSGGPGKGWFRIVENAAQAREVIGQGKLAVILGMEVENPLNCFANARDGYPKCNKQIMRKRLRAYYKKGIRALFPSHKFMNGFSDGDGDTGVLELADFMNTGGTWRTYIDCKQIPTPYEASFEGKRTSLFNSLNLPEADDLAPILSNAFDIADQLLPNYPDAESHCQAHGLTRLGQHLIEEMMRLGMIIDLGHTPRAALGQTVPLLKENQYPAVNTHYRQVLQSYLIKDINGFGSANLGSTCRDENGDSKILDTFRHMESMANPHTGLPTTGLSYDFNGFASYEKPRFGSLSECDLEQSDPLLYPFTSVAGDITFNRLVTGERTYDFNTDGMAHIGMLPELIEEARRAGASTEQIKLLFSTAEAYVQLWERSEARALIINTQGIQQP